MFPFFLKNDNLQANNQKLNISYLSYHLIAYIYSNIVLIYWWLVALAS